MVNNALNENLVKKNAALQEYKLKYDNLQESTSRIKSLCQLLPEPGSCSPMSCFSEENETSNTTRGNDVETREWEETSNVDTAVLFSSSTAVFFSSSERGIQPLVINV